jgi:hypothetical protein
VGFAKGRQFRGAGLDANSSRASVVTDPVYGDVGDGVVVDVMHHGGVHVVDGAVVVEMAVIPIAAAITLAGVSEAIINATVKADVRTPIAVVERVAALVESPIAGSPEGALIGRLNPDAGDPVIAGAAIIPVAGGPKVVVGGSRRLVILGQRRRGVGSGGFGLLSVVIIGIA